MLSDEIDSVRLAAIAALEALHDKVPPYTAGHVMGRDEEPSGCRVRELGLGSSTQTQTVSYERGTPALFLMSEVPLYCFS